MKRSNGPKGINKKIICMVNSILNNLNLMLDKLYQRLPTCFLGRKDDWNSKLYRKYGKLLSTEQLELQIEEQRRRLLQNYLLAGVVFALVIALGTALEGNGQVVSRLKRPAYGEATYKVPLEVELNYKGESYKKNLKLQVESEQLTKIEKEAYLDTLARQLPKQILGENKSLKEISAPLNLMKADSTGDVRIRWVSSKPQLVSSEGVVDLVGALRGEDVLLQGKLQMGEVEREVFLSLQMAPTEKAADYDKSLERRLTLTAEELRKNRQLSYIQLPKDLGNDVKILSWREKKSGGQAEATALFLAACLWLYTKRQTSLERRLENYRKGIQKDFPDMVDQMVLLLNAGMVVTAALEEIGGLEGREKEEEHRPLFRKLAQLSSQSAQSNGSLPKELLAFSRECRIRELIRFSVLVCDNVDKGSALAEKLESESGLLREQRKRRAEERGRLAETKMSIPMLLLLLVLILVTVAPVLLVM